MSSTVGALHEVAAPDEVAALRKLAAQGSRSILVVYDHVPDPNAAGADLRLHQLIEILVQAGNRVALLARGPRFDSSAAKALRALGVEVLGPDPERVFWDACPAPKLDLEGLLAVRRFDCALLYAYFWVGVSVAEQYLAAIRAHSPDTRVLLLSDDCHGLREERRAARDGDRNALERSRGLREKELDSYRRADLLLAITEDDKDRMRALDASLDPRVVGFAQGGIASEVPPFEARSGLVFLGSGGNDANVRSIEWFVAEILPLVREARPEIELAVVGDPPHQGWSFRGASGIATPGRVADLAPVLARARVFVSPVTYGTGLKTKNVQALGAGLPIVATPISAEGMHFDGDRVALVRSDARAFADAVLALHEDRDRWEALSRASLAHARARFGRERVIQDLAAALAAAFERPRAERAGGPATAAAAARVEAFAPEKIAERRLSSRYAARIALARSLRARGAGLEAEQELRFLLCELCCFPGDSPVHAEPHALLAQLYLARGAWDEARGAAELALRLEPDLDPSLRATLGKIADAARRREPATEPARPGPEREPRRAPVPDGAASSPAALLRDARLAFAGGEAHEALELCALALELEPRSPEAWSDLGVVLHALGEEAEALSALERALDLDPASRDARSNRVRLRLAAGDREGARADLAALVAHDPRDPEAEELAAELERSLAHAAP